MEAGPIRVLDPRAFPDQPLVLARRLESLEGATVAMLWNNRPKGDLILKRIAAGLEDRYGTRTVFTNKLRVGTGAPNEVISGIAAEAMAAIVGVGD